MKRLLPLCVAAGLFGFSMTAVAGGTVLDEVTFEPVASGVNGVLAIRHAGDGSGRLFLATRTGQIRVVTSAGTLLSTPFLNIGSGGTAPPLGLGSSFSEQGLLGLAFHPQYTTNHQFYVNYTDGNGDTVVAEYKVPDAGANVADAASGRVILRVYQPEWNHNGGDIHFGPDGYLYIGMGDGGSGNDPCNTGQSLTPAAVSGCVPDAGDAFVGTPPNGVPTGQAASRALLGKMLRIDVDNPTNTPVNADLCGADPALRTYGIPADNPFAGDAGGNAAACDEIYHYGLRNPWRFSFDRQTHDLIIGDVGQGTWEEMNLVAGSASGLNFGWKVCEGFHVRGSASTLCTLAGRTDPILTYRNGVDGISITGGYRYRGPYTGLHGVLFFGDYGMGGKVFATTENAGAWSIAKTWSNRGTVTTFGEGEDGHLYVNNMNSGVVWRIVGPMAPTMPLFENGFESP